MSTKAGPDVVEVKPRYGLKQIAKELVATALGEAYYGNALYVAMDIPGLTEDERHVLKRYLDGTQSGTDHCALQQIAAKIAATVE